MHKRPIYQPMKQSNSSQYVSKLQDQVIMNVSVHMKYIIAIVLHDKVGEFGMRKLLNFFEAFDETRVAWGERRISSEELLKYALKCHIDIDEYVKSIPLNEKRMLTNMKGGIVGGNNCMDSAIQAILLFTFPILKVKYKFSNKKLQEFLCWIKYTIKMYSTQLPCEKGMVFDDEYLRQALIEDEGYDIKLAKWVS